VDLEAAMNKRTGPHSIARVAWSDQAAAGLAGTFGHDRDAIEAGVKCGTLELYRLERGGVVSWMVTRYESGEWTVCCYQGEGLEDLAPRMFAFARNLGLKAIRFYTSRPAIARLLSAHGFTAEETVYRAEVAPNG
jgi:hypothetical protein